MYCEKKRDEWQHTASIVAVLINANRDPKKTAPASPQELNPMESGNSWRSNSNGAKLNQPGGFAALAKLATNVP